MNVRETTQRFQKFLGKCFEKSLEKPEIFGKFATKVLNFLKLLKKATNTFLKSQKDAKKL